MSVTLQQILALVGNLDDSPGENTPRERFRTFVEQNVKEVGELRDYIEECLRTSGDQYSRALQDLINHLGRFLGFEVNFGRYQGVQGKIGFDGHWRSPTGFHIVVEVKTTEVYTIKTATLVNYINELVSQRVIPDGDSALGLYVVGRPDPQLRQLENAIIAERKTQQLRIISAGSLISLSEMMRSQDVAHEDILALLRPSTPTVDLLVDLMARLISEPAETAASKVVATESTASGGTLSASPRMSQAEAKDSPVYWLTPVKSTKEESAEECIQILVGREHIYAFGENTPGRKRIKPGDWICFYANSKGVIGHAKVASHPERKIHPAVHDGERYPWTFKLTECKVYIGSPVVIDRDERGQLDAFRGRDQNQSWAWFVQGTGKITEHDFHKLTRT